MTTNDCVREEDDDSVVVMKEKHSPGEKFYHKTKVSTEISK